MPASTTISATYRLQFNKDFTFRDASDLLDYFCDLGVTHIYASPILRSRHGSSHGYDVIDPSHLNPELGTEADFQAFHEELEKRGMGLIVDIVPNHMAASSENPWWMDVLEHGPESVYASYFDIDWHSRALEGFTLSENSTFNISNGSSPSPREATGGFWSTAWMTSKQNWVKIRPHSRSTQGSPPPQSLCRTARPQAQLQPRWVKSAFNSNSW